MSADLTLAFQNARLLRMIDASPAGIGLTALAEMAGRDKSNLNKTLKALEAGGFLERAPHLVLTQAARLVLAGSEVAEGRVFSPATGFRSLLHHQIQPDRLNPRTDLDSESFKEDLTKLREDILQNGLLQNLVVRAWDPETGTTTAEGLPVHRLISGERRWRAIGEAINDGDWPEDRLIPVHVVETDDLGHRLRALAENLQRRDLSPIEEAKAFAGLVEGGMSTEEIADRVSVTRRQVQLRLQLLDLPEADQARLELPKDDDRHLTISDAKKILQKPKVALPSADDLPLLARIALTELCLKISLRQADNEGVRIIQAEVGPLWAEVETAPPEVATLRDLGWISVHGPYYDDGRYHAMVHYIGRKWMDAVYPALLAEPDSPNHYRRILFSLYCEQGLSDDEATEILDPGYKEFLTEGLAGPFELSPQGQVALDKAKARDMMAEADRQERAARNDRAEQALVTAQRIQDETLRTAFAALDDQFAAALTDAGAPLPWTIQDSWVKAANGMTIMQCHNKPTGAIATLIIAAVAAAAGSQMLEDAA